MSQDKQSENQPEAVKDDAAAEQPAAGERKLTPLEAVKARRAAMQQTQGTPEKHSSASPEGSGGGGPAKRPKLQQRKIG